MKLLISVIAVVLFFSFSLYAEFDCEEFCLAKYEGSPTLQEEYVCNDICDNVVKQMSDEKLGCTDKAVICESVLNPGKDNALRSALSSEEKSRVASKELIQVEQF